MGKTASREARLRQAAAYKGLKRRGEFRSAVKLDIPANVLADRETFLLLKPINISQILLGDPLPGRSALERGPDPQPFRRVDVLDRLRFPG